MAGGNREQAATQKLLANNFDDPKWKTAALKNAYALLGKRRFCLYFNICFEIYMWLIPRQCTLLRSFF